MFLAQVSLIKLGTFLREYTPYLPRHATTYYPSNYVPRIKFTLNVPTSCSQDSLNRTKSKAKYNSLHTIL